MMLNKFFHSRGLVIIICIFLGLIPFFWFKPGYIDIGGDSSRLYFYDPVNFLNNFAINLFVPDSLGVVSGSLYLVPYVVLLAVGKFIIGSPYFLNTAYNSFSVIILFLIMFAIAYDLINSIYPKKRVNAFYASILAGLFYVFIPLSSLGGWDLPLIIISQRFIYPLLFWCFLRYILTSKALYLMFALGISIVFSQNFSWVALPNMISFFSFGMLLLVLFSFSAKKFPTSIKQMIFVIILFVMIQSFQYIPLLFTLLLQNSAVTHQLAQGASINDVINYVIANATYTERGYALFGFNPYLNFSPINLTLLFFPFIIAVSLLRNRKKFPLVVIMLFLILYFVCTGRITNTGFRIFLLFFHLPGFVMFRNYFGKWQDTYLFFYTIVVSFSVFLIFDYIKSYKKQIFFSSIFILILLVNAWPFIRGTVSNRILTRDTGIEVKSRMIVDPEFEKVLSFYRSSKASGRNLSFPFTDFDYQIIPGENNDGAYEGPSMIAYLTGINDLGSSSVLEPFTSSLYVAAQRKDYGTFSNIFPLLNIRTLFYDSDPYIYNVFATFPYNEAREFLPQNQAAYLDFINKLPIKKEYDFSKNFHVFSINSSYFLPTIYIAKKIYAIDTKTTNLQQVDSTQADYVLTHFREKNDKELRNVFIDSSAKINSYTVPSITFSRISSSKYAIQVSNAKGPYLLVFSQAFNPDWQLYLSDTIQNQEQYQKKIVSSYFNGEVLEKENDSSFFDPKIFEFVGKLPVAANRHYIANAYANAWYILPTDTNGKETYTMVLEMTNQRFVYLGLTISIIGIILYLGWVMKEVISYKKYE